MCDYSLAGQKSRLARVNDHLVVHRFETGSKGLADAKELQAQRKRENNIFRRVLNFLNFNRSGACAVCIPPGAKLVISGIPRNIRREFGVSDLEEVTFDQFRKGPTQYRDGVVFKNGQKALLQEFDEGVSFGVISLDSVEEREEVQELSSAR